MPQVVAEITVEVPVQNLYLLAQQVERFPEFMADLERVEMLERQEGHTRTRWTARVPEFNRTIQWVEEDEWDGLAHECRFRQTEGDFDRYQGVWRFLAEGAGTKARLEIDYDLNVPLVGALIKGLIQKKMQQNCDQMLAALKALAEQEGRGA